MKTLHRGVLGVAMVLLVLLAAIPVVWATPEQSLHNQSIPTRTSAPPLNEPVPTPVMAAADSLWDLDAAHLQTPGATATPGAAKAPANALPALPLLPDIASLPARGSDAATESDADGQADALAGASEQPATGSAVRPIGAAPSEEVQANRSPLRWLFPGRSASQPFTVPSLLGMSLLIVGLVLLALAGRHSSK